MNRSLALEKSVAFHFLFYIKMLLSVWLKFAKQFWSINSVNVVVIGLPLSLLVLVNGVGLRLYENLSINPSINQLIIQSIFL